MRTLIKVSRVKGVSYVYHMQFCDVTMQLTHWGQVMHICVSELTIISSDNGLSPGWRQAIIWTNAGILLIGPFEIKFSEILIKINWFSFKKMHLNISAKWQLFCLYLNVLIFSKILKILMFCCFIQLYDVNLIAMNLRKFLLCRTTWCLLPSWSINLEWWVSVMMTSSNGSIFRVTGHLCGEFTGDRWIPHTKASDAELWCFLWSAPE